MKNQALFSSKDKSKKLKCGLLQFLFGPYRVKYTGCAPNLVKFPFGTNGKSIIQGVPIFTHITGYISTK